MDPCSPTSAFPRTESGRAQSHRRAESPGGDSSGQGVAAVQVPGENKVCPERASHPSLTPVVSSSPIGRERCPFLTGGAWMS